MLHIIAHIAQLFSPPDTAVLDSVFLKTNFKTENHIVKLNIQNTVANAFENSALFIRSYGPSGIAVPALRGTRASQTQVVWNGVPIANAMLGETDLNTLGTSNNIRVDLSSNSSLYGSGNVGGTILIQNNPVWVKNKSLQLTTSIGSYGFKFGQINGLYSTKKTYIVANFSGLQQVNNYLIPINNTSEKLNHANLAIYNASIDVVVKPYKNWILKSATQINSSLRKIPNFSSNIGNSKLFTQSLRTMVEASFKTKKTDHALLTAYHTDWFDYKVYALNSLSNSHSFFSKYIFQNQISAKFSYQLQAELQTNKGNSLNYLKNPLQFLPAGILMLNYNAFATIQTQVRWDFAANKGIGKISLQKQVSKFSNFKFAFGNSFRRPTLNELYWGNTEPSVIKPESGFFTEVNWQFKTKKIESSLNVFARTMQNEILWEPLNGQPKAKNSTPSRALGLSLNTAIHLFKIKNHLFNLQLQHEVIESQVLINKQWQKQILIPAFVMYQNVIYTYHNMNATLGYKYQSFLYTNLQNTSFQNGYHLWNASIGYTYKKITITVQGANLLNTLYAIVPNNYMPRRAFTLNLNIHI